jgi:hypothetical protein
VIENDCTLEPTGHKINEELLIRYNPRVTPHWTTATSDNADNTKHKFLYCFGTKIVTKVGICTRCGKIEPQRQFESYCTCGNGAQKVNLKLAKSILDYSKPIRERYAKLQEAIADGFKKFDKVFKSLAEK